MIDGLFQRHFPTFIWLFKRVIRIKSPRFRAANVGAMSPEKLSIWLSTKLWYIIYSLYALIGCKYNSLHINQVSCHLSMDKLQILAGVFPKNLIIDKPRMKQWVQKGVNDQP